MFIFAEEVSDPKRKQVSDHPNGGKVTFQKYAGKLYINIGEYLKPLKPVLTESIKASIPEQWRNELEKVWMDVVEFNKIIDTIKERKEKQKNGNNRPRHKKKNNRKGRRKTKGN